MRDKKQSIKRDSQEFEILFDIYTCAKESKNMELRINSLSNVIDCLDRVRTKFSYNDAQLNDFIAPTFEASSP